MIEIAGPRIGAAIDRFCNRRAQAQSALAEERIRLARDLHDGILQDLAAANLTLTGAFVGANSIVNSRLRTVERLLSDAQGRMREFVESSDPKSEDLAMSFAVRFRQFSEKMLHQWGCEVAADILPSDLRLPQATIDLMIMLLGQVRRATQTVAPSGFASTATQQRAVQEPRGVTSTGFGEGPQTPTARTPRPAAAPGGFEQAPAPKPAAAPPPAPVRADKPVEVLYKPTPAYTDAARAAGVEGDVALEVEFTADGQVRVLRIVRGLGYGLDEMARQAAERIRFRPATSRGTPVDFRATLTIVFRLT
jgi:TonB family protein